VVKEEPIVYTAMNPKQELNDFGEYTFWGGLIDVPDELDFTPA
jgi:hypothetical protein